MDRLVIYEVSAYSRHSEYRVPPEPILVLQSIIPRCEDFVVSQPSDSTLMNLNVTCYHRLVACSIKLTAP